LNEGSLFLFLLKRWGRQTFLALKTILPLIPDPAPDPLILPLDPLPACRSFSAYKLKARNTGIAIPKCS